MNRLQTFQQFLATQSVQIPIVGLVVNLFLAALLAFILSRVYIKYGYSLSNRRIFAKNFMLITVTTMFIITVVKSSLALSLGLVGALSIVRFRAAIKEPEELAYLFLAIAIGLGLGADQRYATLVVFFCIIALLWLKGRLYRSEESQNLHLTISSPAPKVSLEQIIRVLKEHCSAVNLRRFDETPELFEASFMVEYSDFGQLKRCREALQRLNDSINITFLDNQGIS